MGCFAKGCLTVLVIGFIFIAGVICSGWFVFNKVVNNLTSAGPAAVQIEQPSEAQFQAAEKTLARLNQAIANKEETTIEFTSADLNALLARHEDFKEFRGRARIDLADSMMTINVSAPLEAVRWRRLQRRWFNGTARFGLTYSSGEFHLDLESMEAGGHRLSGVFVSNTFSWFDDEGWDDILKGKIRDYGTGDAFLEQVKSISIVGDKMVVKTQKD